MSLLMDALKKAEHAKQQGQTAQPENATDLALELEPTLETAKPAPVSLPELPMQLEVLDQEFMAHAEAVARPGPTKPASRPAAPATTKPEPPAKPPPSAVTGNAQAAAQNVFAAKQLPARSNKTFAIVVGATTLFAGIGIGIYFWIQLQPRSGLGVTVARPSAPQPVSPPSSSQPPLAPAPSQAATSQLAPVPTPVETGVRSAIPTIPATASATSGTPVDSPIRITTGKLKVNPTLAQGFDALSAGQLAPARDAYIQILKAEPKNTDALHGMAAIALREGHPDQAEAYYLRILESDPKDALAQANLIGLHGQGDPTAAESRLKTLLAAQPGIPHLHFALGNLYAAQRRWSEAQQSYFNAMAGDPGHPDYLFNLAVSLDQLHQDRLAAQYYSQALAAAAHRPAGFDQAQVGSRLRELQP